jgi:hypothetical protein
MSEKLRGLLKIIKAPESFKKFLKLFNFFYIPKNSKKLLENPKNS